jgi:CelD/BcsL family acetyltransferase involved in cellulose biosynthesis
MTIECIEDESAFFALREEWEVLRHRSDSTSLFLSHDWIRCCWEELRSSRSLRVFVLRNRDGPVLIAPCMLSRLSAGRLPATLLTFIEHPETQIAGMLMVKGSTGAAAVDDLIQYFMVERGSEWDLLLLDKIPSESQTATCMSKSLQETGRCHDSEVSHESLVIPLDTSWPEYLAHQSPRFRKTLRNIVNRMQKLGRLDLKTYHGKHGAAEATEKLFSVSDASWKVADDIAITSSDKRMRFFKELAAGKVTSEGFRIIILEVDGTPIASETQIIDGGIVYALRSDYDERYADSSPGTFLQMEILKELFCSSYREYNFGVGLNPYKTRWTEERRQLMRYRLYNDTIYGRILNTLDRCQPTLARIPGVRLLNNLFAAKSS